MEKCFWSFKDVKTICWSIVDFFFVCKNTLKFWTWHRLENLMKVTYRIIYKTFLKIYGSFKSTFIFIILLSTMVTLVPNAHIRGNSAQMYWLIFSHLKLFFVNWWQMCVDNLSWWIMLTLLKWSVLSLISKTLLFLE